MARQSGISLWRSLTLASRRLLKRAIAVTRSLSRILLGEGRSKIAREAAASAPIRAIAAIAEGIARRWNLRGVPI